MGQYSVNINVAYTVKYSFKPPTPFPEQHLREYSSLPHSPLLTTSLRDTLFKQSNDGTRDLISHWLIGPRTAH